jgi:hypothetical protein
MGCTTCNKNTETKNDTKGINFIPDNLANSPAMDNIFLKIVVFLVLVIAIPFIITILVLQIFFHFFTPKIVTKINKKATSFFRNIFEKIVALRYKKDLLKRDQQFKENPSYTDVNSEELDIEVFESNDNNEEDSK